MRSLSSLQREHLTAMPCPTLLRNPRSTFGSCVTVCLFWIAAYAPPINGQTHQPDASADAWHFQFDLFQLLLEEQGLSQMVELDDAFATPQVAVIVIVGPSPEVAASLSGQMLSFVRAGGTLLLASDSQLTARGIGSFMTGPVTAKYAKDRYRTFPDCVRVTDINNLGLRFNGVLNLITNRSTWFLPATRGLEWETIARFPRDCLPATNQQKRLLALGRPAQIGPASDAMTGNTGMMLVSADASLFTNGMLWYGDNAVMAIRTSSLLCTPGKSRLAFIADGQLMRSARQRLQPQPSEQAQDLQIPPVPPKPDLAQLLKLVNAVAKEVGDSNVLNETLQQRPRNVQPNRYFQALLVLIIAGLLLWAVWKLLVSGSLRPILLRHRTMRSAYELRAVGGDEVGDYRQSAGYLARELCWELTGSRSSADWQKAAAQLLSAKRAGTDDDPSELIRIIDIASRGRHERMSAVHFQQLGQTIAALRAKQLRAKQVPAQPATVQ